MIQFCADLCQRSYDETSPAWTDVGDLRYGIFRKDDVNVVCIRGTANAENWLRDADIVPKRSCGGYLAHAGFVNAYQKLCAGGMPTVKGVKMVATGHSLGGAIATLLAEHVGCQLISFGSPRVYFRFGSAPKLDHVRVCRDDDPVPRIPALMYSHRCEPLLLKDHDRHLIQVEDHFMTGYVKALAAKGATP